MTITVLQPELAAQIAAGEVIERPASVIKELVENSIDAGATHITVEIKDGGLTQIRVSDDGEGIPASQVSQAFVHHATSKLQSPEQLEAIKTLGFRGEALPSIASVSCVEMITRINQADAGFKVELKWGKHIGAGSHGCPQGTSIGVTGLFGNMPARRKFLRSTATEVNRTKELVARYALAYPKIKFHFLVDGRKTLTTPGSGQLRDVVLSVFGREVAVDLLEVLSKDSESDYQIDGFISPPSLNRANRTYMSFFVNHRWIQSRLLSYAIEESYHGLLPERRYPLVVLNLGLPYSEVDVNCHPTKREVRFHQERLLYSVIQKAVRATLIAESPVPELKVSYKKVTSSHFQFQRVPSLFSSGNEIKPSEKPDSGSQMHGPQDVLANLRVVGQVNLTYIVTEGSEGIYLIDQHAAHERVLFDQIVRRISQRSPQFQRLLEPVAIELTPRQSDILYENPDLLTLYGYEVELFGENTYLLRAIPSIMSGRDPSESFLGVMNLLALEGGMRRGEDVLAASIACHGSIRAGQALNELEMIALLEQLERTENSHTCPHGRPTMVYISSNHVEKEFGRR
jgi:DNA mismatch repair protein MutL